MSDKNRGGSALTKASILMLLSAPAMATTYQPITQCWNAPTAREDGTSLPLDEIRGYKVTYQLSAPASVPVAQWGEVPNTASCVTYTPTSGVQVCFAGIVFDTGGRESKKSNVVCKTPVVIIPPPGPPTLRE